MNKYKASKLLRIIWLHRRYFGKTCVAGLVIGFLIALSIPKEYTSYILLSPESIGEYVENVDSRATNIVEGSKKRDAITPDFYPYIASSPSFLSSLFDIPVQSIDCPPDSILPLFEYIEHHLRRPWWEVLLKTMELLTDSSLEKPNETDSSLELSETGSDIHSSIFTLSARDFGIAAAINARINIKPDVKTRTVAITCRMQDPLVAATVLDTLCHRLQAYITDYRTRKEREDLSHAKQLQEEARAAYYRAQETQAAFEDRNRDLSSNNARKELTRLRVKTAFAKEEYTRATLRVSAAETRVIRVRPVFAVIESATVPVRPASPSKLKYMLAFGLLGLAGGCVRIWWKRRQDTARIQFLA